MHLQFFTDQGMEVPAVSREQMIEVDRVAMAETGPNLYQMMENAGRNLALEAIALTKDFWQDAHIVVLAGGGGNGGGGICAARHLANRRVEVTLCVASSSLKKVPSWQRQIFHQTLGKEITPESLRTLEKPVDLIIDALLGYGLRSTPRQNIQPLIQWANDADAPVLSLDIPSCVDATTGESFGEIMDSQWTLTLALPKQGLWPSKTGYLTLADIGIPITTYRWHTLRIDYHSPFGDSFRVPLRCEIVH